MRENIAFFVTGVIYLAVLYVLVRPNSTGPQVLEKILTTFSDLVRGVAGQTYNSSTGQWSTLNG